MTMTIAEGEVVLSANLDRARTDVAKGVGSLGAAGAGNALKSGLKLGGKIVGGIVATAGAAGLGAVGVLAGTALSKGLDRAISIQNAQAKLTGLGHSGGEVQTIMNNALASVKGTAYGLGDAAGVAAGAVAAGIKPGQDLQRVLGLVADSATIAGTDMNSMGSIFNKVAASGKLQGDVIAQLQDAGVPVLQFVAKEIGKTAEETAKLASDGKIDFKTFSDAMQHGLGGAALASGKTAQGAFANVKAALGRIGAGFLTGPVAQAPVLFTAFGGAIDRLGVSLKPVMADFDIFSGQTMTKLAARLDGIQFDGIVTKARTMTAGVVAALKTVATGQGFSFDLTRAFGLDKAPIVWQIANKTHDVLAGALDVAKILGGDSSNGTAADLAKRFGLDKAPAIYSIATGIHDAVAGMFKGFSGGNEAESIGKSLTGLAPALQSFASQLPNISGAAVKLSGAGLTLLSSALGFLADHVDVIIKFMPVIVAGFLAWQVATRASTAANMALRTAELAALPVQIQRNGLRLAAAALEYRTAAAQRASTAATVTNTAATNGGILANIRNGVAMVGSRVAMAAGAVATGVATAAQWAWNAALTANPIGIIVVAIAALVGGLIWFFTQTKTGQAIWAGFTSFLVSGWQWLQATFTAGLLAVGNFFISTWTNIVTAGRVAWAAVSAVVAAGTNFVTSTVSAGISLVRLVWTTGLNAVSAVARAVWSTIVGVVSAQIGTVRAVVTGGINAVRTVWSAGWNAARAVVSAVVSGVLGVVRSMASGIGGAANSAVGFVRNMAAGIGGAVGSAISFFASMPGRIMGALGGLAGSLVSVGRNLMQGFINGVSGFAGRMVAAVTAPISNAISAAKNMLGIHSPSRVFRQIGDYVGQGLAQGIKGSAKGVSTASRRMTNAVLSEFDRQNRIRNSAARTIAMLSAGNNPLRKTAAGRAQIAREIAAANATIAGQKLDGKHAGWLLGTINTANRQLTVLANNRGKIATRLKAANTALTKATKTRDDYKSTVLQGLTKFDVSEYANPAQIIDTLKRRVAQTKTFTSVMGSLRKAGLDNASYQQFIAAGVDALPQAQALLAGGKGQIKQVASLQGQLGRASNSFATTASNGLYGAGVQAAQGLVRGLQSQQSALDKQMRKIADSMTRSIKKSLGIHSPSRVMRDEVGSMMGAGIAEGITGSLSGIQQAVTGTLTSARVVARAEAARPVPAAATATSVDRSIHVEKVEVNEATDPLGSAGRLRKEFATFGQQG